MLITKNDIVNGAFQLLVISGITSKPTSDQLEIGYTVLDDMAAQLEVDGYILGYIQPTNYGESSGSDLSGLTAGAVGAFKKLLAAEITGYFGKPLTQELFAMQRGAMETLANLAVDLPETQMPDTLPRGSGRSIFYDNKFFSKPVSTDAIIYTKGETDIYSEDWNTWLNGATLTNVEWVNPDNLTISNNTFANGYSSAKYTFDKVGKFCLTVKATKTDGAVTSVETKEYRFLVKDACQ